MESNYGYKKEWEVDEHIDCLDETGKWCNAQIVKVLSFYN